MNEVGDLVDWNDERGFGFVQPATGARLFVHISAFERALRRPGAGDKVAFVRGPGKNGRPAVTVARIVGATAPPRPAEPTPERVESAQLARALRLLAAAILLAVAVVLRVSPLIVAGYMILGAVSFLAYWLDKRAAAAGRWRTSEATLHLLDAMGGIFGGLLAQAALHHKTSKPDFALVTFGIAACHVAALCALAFWEGELPARLL